MLRSFARCSVRQVCRSAAALVTLTALTILTLTALTLPAAAEVTYLADVDLSQLNGDSLLSTSFTSLAAGVTSLEHTSIFVSRKAYIQYDTQTGGEGLFIPLPGDLAIVPGSLAAVHYDTSAAGNRLYLINAQRRLISYNLYVREVEYSIPMSGFLGINFFSMSAASANEIAVINTGGGATKGFRVNPAGEGTAIFDVNGGSGIGEFNNARFLSYGPDGRLYVLDYGNNRVQVLDPKQNYASVFQFSLSPSATITNTQFSISSTGDFYFGDGAGGGSVYDASGNFIQAFSLPPGDYVPGNTGKYYTAATPDGNMMVYDATGEHLYGFSSASTSVPEASTLALALPVLALVGTVLIRRRKK